MKLCSLELLFDTDLTKISLEVKFDRYQVSVSVSVYRLIPGIGRTLLTIICTRTKVGNGTKSVSQKCVPERELVWATWSLNQNYVLQVISEYRVKVLSSVVSLPESFYAMFFLIGSRIFKYLGRLSCPP